MAAGLACADPPEATDRPAGAAPSPVATDAPPAAAPDVDVASDDTMVQIDGGVIELGGRRGMPQLPPPGPRPGAAPGAQGAPHGGGPARGSVRPPGGAAPPPIRQQHAAPASGPLKRWQHRDGVLGQARRVQVPGFFIDRTEVTRAAYQRFLVDTGYRPPFVDEPWAEDGWNWSGTDFPAGTGDHPVVLVSSYDAQAYCAWRGARLPTEAEWQLAMLGPEAGRAYPWGDTYDGSLLNHGKLEQPNFDDRDGFLTTAPVGSFPAGATPAGVLDGFGNAWEFTADHRFEDWSHYEGQVVDGVHVGARAPAPGLYVAVRGGSYFFDLEHHPFGERHAFLPEIRRKTSGFRCARDLGAAE